MMSFEYNKADTNSEYYQLLEDLIERWESETVEFKEAKGSYNIDKIGKYFSAISNEANLKNRQFGWLVLGVSEDRERRIVGTNFKVGDRQLLEKFKYEVSKHTTDGITFIDIIEIYPKYRGVNCRVIMFKIPAAIAGMPTGWNNKYYSRDGDSLVQMNQNKIDTIRNQERLDWSKQILEESGIDMLDKEAILLARNNYKIKMNRPHISEEIDLMNDEQFLSKLKLIRDGKLTNAAMILLGSEDYDYLFKSQPELSWRLYSSSGELKEYEIFHIPYIKVVDKVFSKIRNLTYRYMPDQKTLFPFETQQYDAWMLRELLNNCIAHSNYSIGGRIYVNEFEDRISITNPGNFIPGKVEDVLQPGYNPPFYRNQLLASSMVNFNMIDTQSSGIQKVYRIQRDKFFPMPDYDLSIGSQVKVDIYGKVINDAYMYILFNNSELSLDIVFLLDRVQKGLSISKEAASYLRKKKMIEGRYPNIYPSSKLSLSTKDEAQYIRNKGFKDKYYKDMIINYLNKYGKAKKNDIRMLLWDMLPEILSDKQKESKISNLMNSLKRGGIIETDSKNKQKAFWKLK